MSQADKIRDYAYTNLILPAKRQGKKVVTFSSSDIHKSMDLNKRFPLVCSSIDAIKFQEQYSLLLVKRDGPKQSSTVRWTFEFN